MLHRPMVTSDNAAVDLAACADLELSLTGAGGDEYTVALCYTLPGGEADAYLLQPPLPRVHLVPEALPPDPGPDPAAYGAALATLLFAEERLRTGVGLARAGGGPAPVRAGVWADGSAGGRS